MVEGRKRRIWRAILIALIVIVVVIQFIPVPRSNPPVRSEMPAPPQVQSILRRACYDCHSNETVYPWYVHAAPASWLLWNDVTEGRRELNFSEWDRFQGQRGAKKIKGIWEQVSEGEMPPWYYVMMHQQSKLTDADKQVLHAWVTSVAPGAAGAEGKGEAGEKD